jgi:hypothetical protein
LVHSGPVPSLAAKWLVSWLSAAVAAVVAVPSFHLIPVRCPYGRAEVAIGHKCAREHCSHDKAQQRVTEPFPYHLPQSTCRQSGGLRHPRQLAAVRAIGNKIWWHWYWYPSSRCCQLHHQVVLRVVGAEHRLHPRYTESPFVAQLECVPSCLCRNGQVSILLEKGLIFRHLCWVKYPFVPPFFRMQNSINVGSSDHCCPC